MDRKDSLDLALDAIVAAGNMYLQSKALDLSQEQYLMQRESDIADRALQKRQIDIAENKAESSKSLSMLDVLLDQKKELREERINQEAILKSIYNIQPQYSTKGFKEVSSDLSNTIGGNIKRIDSQISNEELKLEQLNKQIEQLRSEETYFADVSSQYSGLNKVLEEHELKKLVEDARNLERFKETTGAGFRAAYKKEMDPWRRQMMSQRNTTALKSEAKSKANAQYQALYAFTVGNEKFDFEKVFGSEEMGARAQSVLTATDPDAFLQALNHPANKDLRKIFETSPAFKNQLSNIEANTNRVNALQSEYLGITPTIGSPEKGSSITDFEAALSLYNLSDANKRQLFEAYDRFIQSRGITDKSTLNRIFGVLEKQYGQDLEEDFRKYLINPEGFKEEEKGKSKGVKVSPNNVTQDAIQTPDKFTFGSYWGGLVPEFTTTGIETRNQIDKEGQQERKAQEKYDRNMEIIKLTDFISEELVNPDEIEKLFEPGLSDFDPTTLKTVYDSDDAPYDPTSLTLYEKPQWLLDWEEMNRDAGGIGDVGYSWESPEGYNPGNIDEAWGAVFDMMRDDDRRNPFVEE